MALAPQLGRRRGTILALIRYRGAELELPRHYFGLDPVAEMPQLRYQ